MDKSSFQNEDNWIGGYYELVFEFHPTGDTKRLINALKILCKFDEINELYESKDDYKEKVTIVPNSIDEENPFNLYTTINLPDGNIIGAVIIILRVEGESDWLSLSIPIGMLENLYPIDYGTDFSISYEFNNWQKPFDDFLISIAEKLYKGEPFNLGVIGWEALAVINSTEITELEVETTKIPLLIPSNLDMKIHTERDSIKLANGLKLYLP